jgi:hypothetical protein
MAKERGNKQILIPGAAGDPGTHLTQAQSNATRTTFSDGTRAVAAHLPLFKISALILIEVG